MAQQKESKFAARLRELGFVQEEELHTPSEITQTEREFKKATGKAMQIPRAKRREYLAKKIIPAFRHVDGMTLVMDEFCVVWRAQGYVDMSSFNFHNGE